MSVRAGTSRPSWRTVSRALVRRRGTRARRVSVKTIRWTPSAGCPLGQRFPSGKELQEIVRDRPSGVMTNAYLGRKRARSQGNSGRSERSGGQAARGGRRAAARNRPTGITFDETTLSNEPIDRERAKFRLRADPTRPTECRHFRRDGELRCLSIFQVSLHGYHLNCE
jgi:hypothetical protein